MSDEQQKQDNDGIIHKTFKMIEVPKEPPKGEDSIYIIKKSEDPTDTRRLREDK